MSSTPSRRKSGINAKDIGGETLLFSAEGREIHVLNPTAKLIWELCDGQHSVDEMERAIKASFAVPEEHDVGTDIRRTLKVFVGKGLLANAS